LAHISPDEAQVLKDRGGSGTVNPDTGLPEFWANGGGPGGAGFGGSGVHGGADTGTGGARSGGRGAMGNHSGPASAGATSHDLGTVSQSGSRFGNENAAIGVLTKANPNPTAIRDVMGGYNDMVSGPVSGVTGMATPEAVAYAQNRATYGRVLGALVSYGQALMDRNMSLDNIGAEKDAAGVVNDLAGGFGLMAGPALSGVLSGVQAGVGLSDLGKAQTDAIKSGLVGGTVTGSNQGDIASETGGTGLTGAMNSGQTDISKVEGDINRGSFTGDLGDYGRETGGPGNVGPGRASKNAALRTLANAQPLLSNTSTIRPISPVRTQQFRRGGKPAFNNRPLVGE
jgi:hypothetical protein